MSGKVEESEMTHISSAVDLSEIFRKIWKENAHINCSIIWCINERSGISKENCVLGN